MKEAGNYRLLSLYLFFLTFLTNAVNDQGVVMYVETELFLNHVFGLLDPGVTEFDQFTTVITEHVIVLFCPEGFFVVGGVFAKLLFSDEVTFYEELEGIVYRCPAHPVISGLHLDVESLCIEMILPGIDLFKDGKAFRGFAVFIYL